jgi:cytohesin
VRVPQPSAPSMQGAVPLHLAALEGHEAVVAVLLAAGADPNARTAEGRTALHLAAYIGHAGTVAMLARAACVDVGAPDNAGRTPLHVAASKGHGAGECCLVSFSERLCWLVFLAK